MTRMKSLVGSVCAVLVLAVPAHASVVSGELLGVFEGNASVQALFDDLGLVVEQLAKIDTPAEVTDTSLSNDGLTISNLVLNSENEILSGEWSYSGPGIASIIVVKADGYYAAYAFTAANTDNMPNIGLFSVDDITEYAGQEHGLSNIAAYSVVPIPGALVLFASSLLGFGLVRRRTN